MLTQYTFRILVLALGLLTQIGSASGNQQFSIVIQPAHPTILPFEALALSVTVTNVSGAVVSHTCCGIHIQILNDAGQSINQINPSTNQSIGRSIWLSRVYASILQSKRAHYSAVKASESKMSNTMHVTRTRAGFRAM